MNRLQRTVIPKESIMPGPLYDRARSCARRDLRMLQDPLSTVSVDRLRPQPGATIPFPVQMFMQPPPTSNTHYYQSHTNHQGKILLN